MEASHSHESPLYIEAHNQNLKLFSFTAIPCCSDPNCRETRESPIPTGDYSYSSINLIFSRCNNNDAFVLWNLMDFVKNNTKLYISSFSAISSWGCQTCWSSCSSTTSNLTIMISYWCSSQLFISFDSINSIAKFVFLQPYPVVQTQVVEKHVKVPYPQVESIHIEFLRKSFSNPHCINYSHTPFMLIVQFQCHK